MYKHNTPQNLVFNAHQALHAAHGQLALAADLFRIAARLRRCDIEHLPTTPPTELDLRSAVDRTGALMTEVHFLVMALSNGGLPMTLRPVAVEPTTTPDASIPSPAADPL